MDQPAKQRSEKIIIVGAGLAGSLLALDLARMGFEVEVYERRSDPRASGFVGGRSINLALSVRGITALKRVGLDSQILADVIPMRGRIMHAAAPGAPTTFQAYSKNQDEAINSVSRAGLNLALIEAAEKHDRVRVHFQMRCVDIDFAAPEATFEDGEGNTHTVGGDLVIGADGAFSAVRLQMQMTPGFNFSQSALKHGYKELLIPPAAECGADAEKYDGFAMDPYGLHIWPRGGSMMIALPNKDRSFTCTLFWPFNGEHSFAKVSTDPAAIKAHFERFYPDAVSLMPTLVDDFRTNPTSSLVTIRCWPWQIDGRVVLVGDASHAIVPFYGQGMNAAFEDCRILAECIESEGDLATAVRKYEKLRKVNADAIADMALDNFFEMRDRTASRMFLVHKKTERLLDKWFGSAFIPLYNLVSFSNVPYAEARRRSQKQRVVLRVAILAIAVILGSLIIAITPLMSGTPPLAAAIVLALLATLCWIWSTAPLRQQRLYDAS